MIFAFKILGVFFMAIGAAAAAWGATMMGFSFADTMIISGTISVIGGVLTLAAAAALSIMEDIAHNLKTRPATRPMPPLPVPPTVPMPQPGTSKWAPKEEQREEKEFYPPKIEPLVRLDEDPILKNIEKRLEDVLTRPLLQEDMPQTQPPDFNAPDLNPAPAEPEQEQEKGLAILKSGVINGMAYNLYADGSIEAVLPQGVQRFASIRELREYVGV